MSGNHEQYARCQTYVADTASRRGVDFLRNQAKVLRWETGAERRGVDYHLTANTWTVSFAADELIVAARRIYFSP